MTVNTVYLDGLSLLCYPASVGYVAVILDVFEVSIVMTLMGKILQL